MVKHIIFLGILVVFFFIAKPAFAVGEVSPTPTITATPTPAELDQKTSASSTIQNITNFLVNLDSFAGGFVFWTPEDLFKNSIHLKDGTAIESLSIIRSGFTAFAIVIVSLMIIYIGLSNMIEGKLAFLKPFIGRIILYGFLVLCFPLFATQTIKISNALTTAIINAPIVPQSDQGKNTDFMSFITDFYNKGNNQIADGKSKPEDIGVATVGWTNYFQSVSNASMMLFIMVVSFIALVLGMFFIVVQFTLRFLGLLFLSLIFPLVLPFVLTNKTQGIFTTYLKIWFTFLIHQPAFALGYLMVMLVVRSILEHQGASLGLLYLYITSLFFLGTVNVLAARIFADAWTAAALSLDAKIVGGALFGGAMALSKFGLKNKEKIANGAKKVGKSIQEGLDHVSMPKKQPPNFAWAQNIVQDAQYGGKMLNSGIRGGVDTIYGNPPKGYTIPTTNSDRPYTRAFGNSFPKYANEFNEKGFSVETVNGKRGIYAVSGTGYNYYDGKNNLTYTFPSKQDALDSGYKENQIRSTTLAKQPVLDISQPGKITTYNTSATKKSQAAGHDSNYAHVNHRADPERIRHNLEFNQEKLSKNGIQGYIVRRYDNPNGEMSSKRDTTRIVRLGKV